MGWDAIGAIGEIAGAFAVLVSLIFVGLQVRHSAEQTKTSNLLARADMSERLLHTIGDTVIELARNPELAKAFRKVMFERTELTPLERTLVGSYFNVWLMRHRAAFISASNGLIDAQLVREIDATTQWYLTAPEFAEDWHYGHKNGLFSGPFAEHVNQGLSQPLGSESN